MADLTALQQASDQAQADYQTAQNTLSQAQNDVATYETALAEAQADGNAGNIQYAQVNAECLPFADNTFDCVCIGFGLRNVTDKDAALRRSPALADCLSSLRCQAQLALGSDVEYLLTLS